MAGFLECLCGGGADVAGPTSDENLHAENPMVPSPLMQSVGSFVTQSWPIQDAEFIGT